MDMKKYLSQAYRIDQRINSKLEQILSLRSMAAKVTSTINDMPVSGTKNAQSMESIIAQMIDLEKEINHDILELIETKRRIMKLIKSVKNLELQTLLELRYLCYKTWEQIAVDLSYGIDNVFKMHQRAMQKLESQQTLQ